MFAWLGGFTLALPDGGILNHRSSSFSESSFRCTVARMDIEGVDVVTNVAVLARFGHALSDETRTRILLELKTAPRYPSDLAETLAVTRQKLSNHLACLRGCGLVVAVPEAPDQIRTRRCTYRSGPRRPARGGRTRGGSVVLPGQRIRGGVLLMVAPVDGVGLSTDRRALLSRRIRIFVAITISYNVVEAIIALAEGTRVSSAALFGFGLDSVIEVSSAAAVAWQFSAPDPTSREKTALRVIAFSFFGLAAYVSFDAIRSLFGLGEAQHTSVGILLAAVSLAIMPALSYAQRRAGRELGSLSAVADSKQTLLCTYLSAVLLVGLLLNSLLGWSWADPIAALVIAVIAVKEGINAWKGDPCCPVVAVPESGDECDCC